MSDDEPTQAAPRTRAEDIRERYYWHGHWHTLPKEGVNGRGDVYRVAKDRGEIIDALDQSGVKADEAQEAMVKAQKARDAAQKAYEITIKKFREHSDRTDMYKMALADIVQVPR